LVGGEAHGLGGGYDLAAGGLGEDVLEENGVRNGGDGDGSDVAGGSEWNGVIVAAPDDGWVEVRRFAFGGLGLVGIWFREISSKGALRE
jgi:hypothetical protein